MGPRLLPGRRKSLLRRRHALRDLAAIAIALVDIIDHQRLEVGSDRRAAQGAELLAVDENRRGRGFAGAGQRNADIGVLGFAGAVDDATHGPELEACDAWMIG